MVASVGATHAMKVPLETLTIPSSPACMPRACVPNDQRLIFPKKKGRCFLNIWRGDYSKGRAFVGSKYNMKGSMTDELDNLLDRYGKVIYTNGHQNTPVADSDDDSECLSLALALAKVASDIKAADIRVLYVKPLVYWTHFFVIATAFSNPQMDAMGSKIRDIAEQQFKKSASGDVKPNSWMLLDFGDVVVHLFLPEQRAFYNLEEFYGNATSIDLPFEV
eukprot:TRINITY_DN8164_c0_g1_i2.p1 TRINITY_DN8164_c0_g1~~TRINITY_DN8164_c0_g1_i2.p1  ORF type:complete len:220 (+),score=46.51 TRINITY_DN8164_c0_g1_i2:228-887(+)